MPKRADKYMDELDAINKMLEDGVRHEIKSATEKYYKKKAEYEMKEAETYASLNNSPATSRKDEARAQTKINNKELYQEMSDAHAEMEGLVKTIEVLDIQRSNVQSNLKVLKG